MTYESKQINTKSEYLEGYRKNSIKEDDLQRDAEMENAGQTDLETKKIKNAMKVALDTRKFEIDLYWKRANYFWLYNVSAFTAYFYVILHKEIEMWNTLTLLITGIGVFLSLCWVFVNKASKYWQENWESHVDLLEDDYMGSLYKTTLKHKEKRGDWINPIRPFKYSVSKINQLMSFGIFLLWVFLLILTLINVFQCKFFARIYTVVAVAIAVVVTSVLPFLLRFFCSATKPPTKKFGMERIKIEDEKENTE